LREVTVLFELLTEIVQFWYTFFFPTSLTPTHCFLFPFLNDGKIFPLRVFEKSFPGSVSSFHGMILLLFYPFFPPQKRTPSTDLGFLLPFVRAIPFFLLPWLAAPFPPSYGSGF